MLLQRRDYCKVRLKCEIFSFQVERRLIMKTRTCRLKRKRWNVHFSKLLEYLFLIIPLNGCFREQNDFSSLHKTFSSFSLKLKKAYYLKQQVHSPNFCIFFTSCFSCQTHLAKSSSLGLSWIFAGAIVAKFCLAFLTYSDS